MFPTGFLILPTFESHQKCVSPAQRETTELILTAIFGFLSPPRSHLEGRALNAPLLASTHIISLAPSARFFDGFIL